MSRLAHPRTTVAAERNRRAIALGDGVNMNQPTHTSTAVPTRPAAQIGRFARLVAGTAMLALIAAGCGGGGNERSVSEAVTEDAVEDFLGSIIGDAVESETGQDVDFSFGGGDGDDADVQFSIDVGEQTITVDSETGTVDISGGAFDDDGTDDSDDSFAMSTSVDEDDTVVTEWTNDDGSTSFSAVGTTPPDVWPSALLPPADAIEVSYLYGQTPDGTSMTMSFETSQAAEELLDTYRPYFSDWDEAGEMTMGDPSSQVTSANFTRGTEVGVMQFTTQEGRPTIAFVQFLDTATP